LHITLSCSLY